MAPLGEVRKRPDGYDVIFERRIPHPIRDVWAMLTEPEKIETWFCARVDIDGRVGGAIVEHHDHVAMDVPGEVRRWEPPQVFEHTWWFGNSVGIPIGSVLWELFPEEADTRLVLTDSRASFEAAEGGLAGRHICLDVLAVVLDGADPAAHAAPEGEFRDGAFVPSRPGRGLWEQGPQLEQEYRRSVAALG